MKKTLITLLALGGIALAGDSSEPVWTLTSTSTTTTTDKTDPYGLVFDINAGTGYRKTLTGSESVTPPTLLTLQSISLGTTATSVSCNFVLLGNLTGASDGTTSTGDILGYISQDDVSIDGGVATLNFAEQGILLANDKSYRLFFTTTDYSTTEVGTQITLSGKTSFNMTGYTAGVDTERVHLGFLGSGLGPGLKQGWTPVVTMKLTVPEPATATLSLLALAGLAARRKRH